MSSRLNIEHAGFEVGLATSDDSDRFSLKYDDGWRGYRHAFPLSLALPLSTGQYGPDDAHDYFANLLPEGAAREAICQRLGVSFDNDVALLTALGNDTAGAFRYLDASKEAEEARPRTKITDEWLERWATGAPALPDADHPIRLSLAGAQHKTSAVIDADGWAIPANDEASTHILKFDSVRFRNLSLNEFFTTRVAAHLDLHVARVELRQTDASAYLTVERYDRVVVDGLVERLHQEDFCQALGLPPRRKYESEGGPGLAQVARLLRSHSAAGVRDVARLVQWAVFCVLAGNADGHAKNLSLLYEEGSVFLAPFYDLVCTRAYDGLDRNLAMSIGGARLADRLTKDEWSRMAKDIGVKARLVFREIDRQLEGCADAIDAASEDVLAAIGEAPALPAIRRSVEKRARALRQSVTPL